jgi:hypothetical protein
MDSWSGESEKSSHDELIQGNIKDGLGRRITRRLYL